MLTVSNMIIKWNGGRPYNNLNQWFYYFYVLEPASSSNNHHQQKYDVFLSFRGVDTRCNFTNHLHKALEGANLKIFLDNEEIQTGLYLKPELEIAIKSSRASIIVLSENYASSSWCLDELVLILDQHKNFNQIVIPVFYHVKPTDVRKQRSTFKNAMNEHKKKMEAETDVEKKCVLAEKIEIWKETLAHISHITGKDAKGRLETEFIEEIVKDIYHRIRVPIRSTLPLLIGMDDSIKFVSSWLKEDSSHNVDILTLYGMGGIGKTSLAKYVYMLNCREFNRSSFVEDINRRCAKLIGLIDVQKQLCDDISKTGSVQVHDVSVYTSVIENAVTSKKVLLVLDDIDSLDQLDALLGNKGFHPGSKIIITTKDASLTERCALFNPQVQPKHKKHLVEVLHKTASLELLCLHAFESENYLKEGYEDVSDDIVKYCEGHPLALKVLGRSLHNRDVAFWEDCIKGLKKEPGSCINNVLKLSFDTLESKNDKELFKHIACFFVGTDRDIAETILKACDINTKTGITHLIDRCLLRDDWNYNVLMMHSLIQEMGRNEVRQESPDKPWKRSRLWCHEESFKVLKQKKGKGKIKGLTLDMKMLEDKKLSGSKELKTYALSDMDNLMILHLDYVQMNGSYENFPEDIRWLRMHGFPLKSIPSELPMKNLVALDLSYSDIESFGESYSNQQPPGNRLKQSTGSCSKDTRLLGSLKILDVSYCKQLRCLGGFFEFPKLERLMVSNCIGLIDICESIEQCVELVFINLRYCNKLLKLPRSLGKLKKVKTLLLDGCNFGKSQSEMMDMDSVKVNNIGISSQTSSSSIVMAISRDLKSLVVSFPSSLVRLSLAYNNLSCESFPMDLSSLSMLKNLDLGGNQIVSMPNCVRTLPRLEYLTIDDCNKLMSIENPPRTLTYVYSNSKSLRKVVFDPEMSPIALHLGYYALPSSSIEIEGVVKIQAMAYVEERVLHSMGWSNLEFTKKRRIGTYVYDQKNDIMQPEGYQTQMYYEFGIFSTIYGGKEMPKWIRRRSKGSSISFTLPSSPKNLRGLNICYVLFRSTFSKTVNHYLPLMKISNITKNRTWIYKHYVSAAVSVGGKWLTFVSHWMFGMNDMEPGDHVTITVEKEFFQITKKCGVSFVYGDGSMEEEEEDALSYYKSWNHIIGGHLSSFQLTTGEYFLDIRRFGRSSNRIDYILPHILHDNATYIDDQMFFKALSRRKTNKLV